MPDDELDFLIAQVRSIARRLTRVEAQLAASAPGTTAQPGIWCKHPLLWLLWGPLTWLVMRAVQRGSAR